MLAIIVNEFHLIIYMFM